MTQIPQNQPTEMQTHTRAQLSEALATHGLRLRGGWRPCEADAVPALPCGQSALVVWMVGAVGSELWPAFRASSYYSDGLADPLDRWSRAIGDALAQRWNGVALFPFDGPPYHPFQQWASRAEALHPSQMMLRIHPEYGLWHAYRFALALPTLDHGDLPDPDAQRPSEGTSPCLDCDGKPCLQACPVQAYTGAAFLLDACRNHLHGSDARDCMQSGCLARGACPQGREFAYTGAHAAFHMQAFRRAHSDGHPGRGAAAR